MFVCLSASTHTPRVAAAALKPTELRNGYGSSVELRREKGDGRGKGTRIFASPLSSLVGRSKVIFFLSLPLALLCIKSSPIAGLKL